MRDIILSQVDANSYALQKPIERDISEAQRKPAQSPDYLTPLIKVAGVGTAGLALWALGQTFVSREPVAQASLSPADTKAAALQHTYLSLPKDFADILSDLKGQPIPDMGPARTITMGEAGPNRPNQEPFTGESGPNGHKVRRSSTIRDAGLFPEATWIKANTPITWAKEMWGKIKGKAYEYRVAVGVSSINPDPKNPLDLELSYSPTTAPRTFVILQNGSETEVKRRPDQMTRPDEERPMIEVSIDDSGQITDIRKTYTLSPEKEFLANQ